VIDRITENLIPIMLLKVAAVSSQDKRRFAELLVALCASYLNDNKLDFQNMLDQTSFSEDWKRAVTSALWTEDARENPRQR
jgi:hypothetical protein